MFYSDMIGGNGYNTVLPEKELFVRWMQANVFMPAMQFSYTPWDYNEEVSSFFFFKFMITMHNISWPFVKRTPQKSLVIVISTVFSRESLMYLCDSNKIGPISLKRRHCIGTWQLFYATISSTIQSQLRL